MENSTNNKYYTIPNDWLYEDKGGLHLNQSRLNLHFLTQHHYVRIGNTELMRFDGKRYVNTSANDCKGEIKQHIPLEIRMKKHMDAVYNELITEPLVSFSSFNADESIINMSDGILHLDTMTKTPHSHEVYSTILIPCSYSPGMTFDDCPKFRDYLNELVNGDEELKMLILEYMGVIVSNVYGYRYKKMLMLHGKGNTGKSVLRELIIKIIGEENNHSINIEQLNSDFGAAQVKDKLLCGAGDMTVKSLGQIEIIKSLTGSDNLNGNRKHKDAISFQYRGLLMFCCNELPRFDGDKGVHVYERFLIIPCNNVVEKSRRNSQLVDELFEERNAIVSIAIDAMRKTIERGYKFTEGNVILEQRKKYEILNNSLFGFVEQCCILNEGVTRRSEFNYEYGKWCKDNKLYVEPKNQIGKILREKFQIEARKMHGGIMCYDLKINYEKAGQ